MIPPRSLRNTDKVDVYGARVESDDGVNHSRNCVVVAPRKLDGGGVFTILQGDKNNCDRLLGLYHVSDVKKSRTLSHMLMAGNCR